MTDAARIGAQARTELELTERAFAMLEAEMLEGIASSQPSDTEKREGLFHGINALRRVRQALIMAVSGAAIDEHNAALTEAGFQA